jgi:hypothetical protein
MAKRYLLTNRKSSAPNVMEWYMETGKLALTAVPAVHGIEERKNGIHSSAQSVTTLMIPNFRKLSPCQALPSRAEKQKRRRIDV